jgi:hypothetical protein
MTQAIDPVQFDTELFALYQEHARTERQLQTLFNFKVHPMAGDRQESLGWGKGRRWLTSDEDALSLVRHLADEEDVYVRQLGMRPSEIIANHDAITASMETLWNSIVDAEQVWQEHRWTRWFPCLNADGHVHSTLRGCPTIDRGQYATQMGWATELSGTPLETAIQMPPVGLGPRLCSVCFPDAPVEHCRSLRDITRAEREAEKTARAEAKFIKNLRPEEMVNPDGSRLVNYSGSRITTVAGLKTALRDEVEYRDYYGHGEHTFHADSVKAAENAKRVLLGRGATQAEIDAIQAEIDTIIENAVKRNRKDGARI